ncbi:MAG: Response regulator receiver domain [Acidobacteriota bacterium]|nr:Response regulator receiver domain [Acidobacteriota bacterium]
MVRPSCPALVIHDDDAFRKNLIASLDQNNFMVTFAPDGDGAVEILQNRRFNVVILGLNLATRKGVRCLEVLQTQKTQAKCGVIILGDPSPEIRTFAPWADETLLKPVDAWYVATRARSYCE